MMVLIGKTCIDRSLIFDFVKESFDGDDDGVWFQRKEIGKIL
jgi:hypothetical protein